MEETIPQPVQYTLDGQKSSLLEINALKKEGKIIKEVEPGVFRTFPVFN